MDGDRRSETQGARRSGQWSLPLTRGKAAQRPRPRGDGWANSVPVAGTSLALDGVLRRASAGAVATVPLSIPGAILSEEGSNVFGLLVKRGQGSEHQVVSLSRSVGWRPELKD